jgi:hypothetical protein
MLEELIAEAIWAEHERAMQAAMIRYELLHGVGRLPGVPARTPSTTPGRRWWARLTFARE